MPPFQKKSEQESSNKNPSGIRQPIEEIHLPHWNKRLMPFIRSRIKKRKNNSQRPEMAFDEIILGLTQKTEEKNGHRKVKAKMNDFIKIRDRNLTGRLMKIRKKEDQSHVCDQRTDH